MQTKNEEFMLHGIPLFTSPLVPHRQAKMRLSEALPVSGVFRARINAWLREFFGDETPAYYMLHPVSGQKVIMVHPSTLAEVKRNTDEAKALFEFARGIAKEEK